MTVPSAQDVPPQTYRAPDHRAVELAIETLSMTWDQVVDRANRARESANEMRRRDPYSTIGEFPELTIGDLTELLMTRIGQLELELRMLLASVGYRSAPGTELPYTDFTILSRKNEGTS